MGERIVLGSGKLYVQEFSSSMPTTSSICTSDNLLGYIQGGATLEYTPTMYEAKDDLGYVQKTVITAEEAILKSGVLTFNGKTLKKLVATGRVTENATTHIRTVKIGGIANNDGKKYAICFHHEDDTDGDIWILIKGKNQSGFSLSFAKDKETVIDAEFKAESQDNDGTLIVYEEEDTSITQSSGS